MFIGNSRQYTKLLSWITKPIEPGEYLHYKHICIIIGDPGTGKSYGINSAVQSCSKILYRLNDLDCNNSKDFRDLLTKITSSHIVSQINNISNSQKIIWLDDFDSYLIFDRTFLHTLQHILDDEKFPAIQIIISTTTADIKHYTKFYNLGCVIKLNIPDSGDLIVYLRKTFTKLSITKINQIAEVSNGNVSSAIQMAQIEESILHIKQTENNIADADSNTSTDYLVNKIDNFPDLVHLFDEPYNIEVGRFLFDQDPWLHPLRFHENILHEFKQRKGVQNNKDMIYTKILELFCIWDRIMSYAKINDGSGMNIAIELISHVPYLLKEFPKKKTSTSSMDEFTRMFNYLSLKKKNAVALYVPEFPWINIGSYYKHFYDDKNKKTLKAKKFST